MTTYTNTLHIYYLFGKAKIANTSKKGIGYFTGIITLHKIDRKDFI